MTKLRNALTAIFHGFIGTIGLALFVIGIFFSGLLLYKEPVLNSPNELVLWITSILAIVFGAIFLLVSLRKYAEPRARA